MFRFSFAVPDTGLVSFIAALFTFTVFCHGAKSPTLNLFKCHDDFDCSLNGVCAVVSGSCTCDQGWTGPSCKTLDVQPTEWDWGYNKVGSEQTSSWGGGGWYDAQEGRFFMWVTELSHKCGMHTWTTNSKTVRASSLSFHGPYEREEDEFPVWTHEATVTRGPKGEYVAFMSYKVPSPYPECVDTCNDGSTPPGGCQKRPAGLTISSRDPTYMTWAPRPRGPWSEPVPVLMPNPQMDTNMAAAIDSNGRLIGLWRDHKAGKFDIKHSVVHSVTAANWTDPSTYRWNQEDLLFGPISETARRKKMFMQQNVTEESDDLEEGGQDIDDSWTGSSDDSGPEQGSLERRRRRRKKKRSKKKHAAGNPGGVEDMFIWIDKRGNYHAVMHQMFGCIHCVGHAASTDGLRWLYTGPAAYRTTKYTNGTSFTFSRTERPKIIFGKDGTTPVALTQGVKPAMAGFAGDDESFTLLRPIGPGSSSMRAAKTQA